VPIVPDQKLTLSRVPQILDEPKFLVTSRVDSAVDLPDLDETDEARLRKYGTDLTANFAEIRLHGAEAFFQKTNESTGKKYWLCACATGYIWVNILQSKPLRNGHEREVDIQIGTFALKTRAISTTKLACNYNKWGNSIYKDEYLAALVSSIMAKYIRFRIMGYQYEEAADLATPRTRSEMVQGLTRGESSRLLSTSVDEVLVLNHTLLRNICLKAPLPPVGDVSMISRSMITKRWRRWSEHSVLRNKSQLAYQSLKCLQSSQGNSLHLLSGRFDTLEKFESLKSPTTSPPVQDITRREVDTNEEDGSPSPALRNEVSIPQLPESLVLQDTGIINLSIFGAVSDK
jgi:hypothetical protein